MTPEREGKARVALERLREEARDGVIGHAADGDAAFKLRVAVANDHALVCAVLDEARATIERLTAELDEARLEIAALQGRPEGAISPEWKWDGATWERTYDEQTTAFVEYDGIVVTWVLTHEPGVTPCACGREDAPDVVELRADSATMRAGMRDCDAAEAAATARGWPS